MTEFDRLVYDIVRELQDARVEAARVPASVSLRDITVRVNEEVKRSLNGFVKDGTMSWYPDLNKIPMFSIKGD